MECDNELLSLLLELINKPTSFVESVSAWLVPLIAGLGLYIAWRQWKTNHVSLNMSFLIADMKSIQQCSSYSSHQ